MKSIALLLAAFVSSTLGCAGADHLVFEGKDGPGKGKHVVLLAGDEEYRSEEALPMLAKILSQHHGFKCTVLFSVGEDGVIDPNNGASLTHPEALDSADAIVMLLRFRHWDDEVMKKFETAFYRGVPIIALRTSTHAFNYPKESLFASWTWNTPEGGFGREVLGETWVSHWGKHKKEATKGVVEPAAKDSPILRGVSDVFGTTDVYEAKPLPDANILMRGQVLIGMNPEDPPADYRKPNKQEVEQGINDPMMPIAWTRDYKNPAGNTNRIFCTTMGAATDLANEGLRRMVVNAVFWGLGLEVPEQADVTLVDPYEPLMYGFKGFKPGMKPSDYDLQSK